ncbi:MAG: V-type ATP synthase subunit E [Elusimicrobiota bacterium]|nr:V-type ATP synthase subunit E [Elusimicrobiota bacterium]
MEIIGDAKGLVREVLAMARLESEGIVAAAEAEAGKIISAAEAAAEKVRREMTESALAGAARQREMMLAALAGEEGRLRLERREALLASIREEAVGIIRARASGAGKTAILAALAARAVSRMEGKIFMVSVAPGDAGAAAGLPAGIERLAGRGPLEITIEVRAGLAGGVIVRDYEGRQYWDNSFAARLERFWPELRGRLLEPGEAK